MDYSLLLEACIRSNAIAVRLNDAAGDITWRAPEARRVTQEQRTAAHRLNDLRSTFANEEIPFIDEFVECVITDGDVAVFPDGGGAVFLALSRWRDFTPFQARSLYVRADEFRRASITGGGLP